MFRKLLPILLALPLPACSNDLDALAHTCQQIESASALSHDCAAMSAELYSHLPKLSKQLDSLRDITDPALQQKYLQAVGPCMSSLFEIRVGLCHNDPGVKQALLSLENVRDPGQP